MKTTSTAAEKDGRVIILLFALVAFLFVTFNHYISPFLRIFILTDLAFSLIIARVGRDREIGYVKAFISSFCLSPLIGLILTLSSTRIADQEYKERMLVAAERNNEGTSVADQLFKLNELRKDGILTDEEFSAQKEKLLNS